MADERPVLVDCHTHAWRRWPYSPPVPDEDTRGAVELLLHEMDVHGVLEAAVVVAAIENNLDNLDYVASARERHPDRLHVFADLDCTWHATYHQPGSAERLRAIADRHPIAGFAHYAAEENDGWLRSEEADAVFTLAAERRLIVSLGVHPAWQADLRELARRHPSVPVLCQALGLVRGGEPPDSPRMTEVLASASVGSIHLKVCGLPYCAQRDWDYPWPDVLAQLERIHDSYGPRRLCWGSDFPAGTRYATFRQSLEAIRSHCPFLEPSGLSLILGENFRRMLATGQTAG